MSSSDASPNSPWPWLLPAIVGAGVHFLGLVALLVYLLAIVPSFTQMFAEVGVALPVLTQVVVSLSESPLMLLLLTPFVLAIDAATLALLARRFRPLWAWLLAAAELILLGIVLTVAVVGIYLPIFQMSAAISG